MNLIKFGILYVFLHIFFYIAIGRNLLILRSELGIFLFHFLSFVFLIFCCIVGFAFFYGCSYIPSIIGLLSLHGIYSLSFLELWSLSQGSYSLSVLRLAPIKLGDQSIAMQELESIGNVKFAERLESIKKLGLLCQHNNKIKVTAAGAKIAIALIFITKLTNMVDRG